MATVFPQKLAFLTVLSPEGCKQHVQLSCRNDLVGTGRAIFVLFGMTGARNK